MALLGGQPRIRDGIEGRAVVIAARETGHALVLRLAVRVPERAAYDVELRCRAPSGKRPHRGQILHVLVDRSRRDRVRVDWERAPTLSERAERLIERARAAAGD